MEEAKTQENAKLQSALQEMQLEFKESKELLMKERGAAKRAAEQIPVIQEVSVIDHAMVDKLAAENEKLKVRMMKSNIIILLKDAALYSSKAFQECSLIGEPSCAFLVADI